MMPGSPERVLLRNQYLTQEKIDQVRAEWGLDKPLLPRTSCVGFVDVDRPRGDLGYSFFSSAAQPVVDVIGERFWPTIILIGLGRAHLDRRRPVRSAPMPAGDGAARPTGSAAGVEPRSSTRCRTS